MSKTDDTPPGSLGMPIPGFRAAILDPESGDECPRAQFDEHGRLLNAEEAIGEIVNPDGAGSFEGYYNNPEANAQRMRDGKYWTGDLGYRDDAGFFYFAGRNSDWLRVDGENFAAAPVEQVISRHPDVVLAAVYAVPSPDVGDEVMAAIHLHDGTTFDPDGFVEFLRCAVGPFPEVDAALRADLPRPAVDRDAEGAQAGACNASAGSATTTCGGGPDARLEYRPLEASRRRRAPGPFRRAQTASTCSVAVSMPVQVGQVAVHDPVHVQHVALLLAREPGAVEAARAHTALHVGEVRVVLLGDLAPLALVPVGVETALGHLPLRPRTRPLEHPGVLDRRVRIAPVRAARGTAARSPGTPARPCWGTRTRRRRSS